MKTKVQPSNIIATYYSDKYYSDIPHNTYILYRIEGGELVNMNDCMAYGQVTAPSRQNLPSAQNEIVYDSIWHINIAIVYSY